MSTMAETVLGTWLNAVNDGDVDGALKLYSPAAVMLPTFCSDYKVGPDDIRPYFEEIESKGKVTVTLDQDRFSAHLHPGGLATITGFYTWYFEEEGRSILARFTFTLDTNRVDPILHHHSSVTPEC